MNQYLFITTIIVSFFLFSLNIGAENVVYSNQNPFEENHGFNNITPVVETKPFRVLLDSNAWILLPKKNFALLFFYSHRKVLSVQMKDLLKDLKIKRKMPFFSVDTDLNKDLMRAYNVKDTPSIAIIQNKRLIYSTIGFTDNIEALSDIINTGIENNLLIQKRNG